MTGLDLSVGEELSHSFEPCLKPHNRALRVCRCAVYDVQINFLQFTRKDIDPFCAACDGAKRKEIGYT